MIGRLWWWISPLLCDPQGRACGKRIGSLVAGVTWTAFMWRQQPQSVEMWSAYAGVVMTWATVQLGLVDRPRAKDSTPPQ